MILLIDNYDSFSYNLYQLIGEIDPDIKVIRNDEMTVDEIKELTPDRMILSPGPGRPEDAGIIVEAVKILGKEIPILGVCLGHQAICTAFGLTITYAKERMHGKQSDVKFDINCPLFAGCPETAPVARYHSLAADADTISECLKITAFTADGEVMAVQHKEYPIYGVQFHPESIMTPDGKQMLRNFIKEILVMIKEAIVKIVNKEDLTYDEAYSVMNEIMSGETTATQNAAFLAALSTKSARAETTDEIAGCAAAMRAHAMKVETGMDLFEIVGTGGDNAHSFNISTTSALVAAAGGMKVAKHGNRAASSQCGTADCLEALGVNIQQSPERCLELLDEVGMCFFFAQKYHTSMKHVGAIRKELGFRTVFNILGPLTNPGTPSMQLLGVYDEYLVEPLAQVLIQLGIRRGMVVYGQDKLDEISMSAPTTICEIRDGWFKSSVITPEDFGFERCTKEDLKGGAPEENAKITLAILNGERGYKRNAVLLNAGAALYIGGKSDSMKEGIALAAEIIDSGKALETLNKLIEVSNRSEV